MFFFLCHWTRKDKNRLMSYNNNNLNPFGVLLICAFSILLAALPPLWHQSRVCRCPDERVQCMKKYPVILFIFSVFTRDIDRPINFNFGPLSLNTLVEGPSWFAAVIIHTVGKVSFSNYWCMHVKVCDLLPTEKTSPFINLAMTTFDWGTFF